MASSSADTDMQANAPASQAVGDVPTNSNSGCVGTQSDMAGKASSCQGCPNQTVCASGKPKEADPTLDQVADNLSEVKNVILVLSGKGGVGKSSFSAQLAWTLSDMGKQVGILDIDICGPSVARMMGVENEKIHNSNNGWSPVYADDNLAVMSIAFMLDSRDDAVVWRGPRKNGLIKQFLTDVQWGALDYLIVDAPPGTSDEHISIVSYLKKAHLAGAVVITTPQEVALLDVRKEISFCKKTSVPVLGVVENMSGFVCPCCKHKSDIFPPVSGGAKQMAAELKVPFFGAIPLDPQLLADCESGVSFTSTHPDSAGAAPFKAVVQELLSSLPGASSSSSS